MTKIKQFYNICLQDIDLPEGFEVVQEGGQALTPEEIIQQEETSGNTFE